MAGKRRKRFNQEWVLGNLRETVDHIESAITEVASGNEGGFEAWIESIYRDLNRAWNGRHMSFDECHGSDERIRAFPPDIDFGDGQAPSK